MADLSTLKRALGTTSRTTVFRALREAGYTTSYSHTGRYYTLEGVPQYDAAGLWAHGEALFSRHGTLRETVVHLVEEAPAGQTHAELRDRLRLRVQDTLRDLTASARIGRVQVERLYVYVSEEQAAARAQLARRQELLARPAASTELGVAVVVEVLLEVIHSAGAWAAPEVIARRLCARGIALSPEQVERVLRDNGIEKKRARSGRSPR